MSNTRLLGLFFCSTIALGGCAASPPPDAGGPHHGEHGGHHGEHEGEHHGEHEGEHHGEHGGHEGEHHEAAMAPTLKTYHDILAPIWHSEPGAVRVAKTCEGQASLASGAAAVVSGEVPAAAQADAEGWKAAAEKMKAGMDALAEACAAEGRPNVESGLSQAHDSFHELLDRSKGKR